MEPNETIIVRATYEDRTRHVFKLQAGTFEDVRSAAPGYTRVHVHIQDPASLEWIYLAFSYAKKNNMSDAIYRAVGYARRNGTLPEWLKPGMFTCRRIE